MTSIILPHKFIPRPYQLDTFEAFFKNGYKRFIDIEHRRAGKDKKWLNMICAASQQRVGTYIHTFPKLSQAKKAIWKGMDSEGFRFLNHFPSSLIRDINKADLSIEFKNGSIYQLLGADNYNNYMGAGPVGIVFSEYALQDPDAWGFFEPMLGQNKGWASFIYTPRGKNHGYELYEQNKDNPSFFTQLLTIKDTKTNDGIPIYTKDYIEEIRRSGTPEEMIQQEYYCSFEGSLVGAYYSKEMTKATEEGRITRFPLEPTLPVHTFWDLGLNDANFIWFMQVLNGEFRFIHCYEVNDEGMPHFVNYLHDFRNKHGIVYGQHHPPHDIAVRELGTGLSRRETAASLGLRFETPKPKPLNTAELMEHIHICRMILPKCWFHVEHCKRGIRCLKEYSKAWDDKNKTFKDRPRAHHWSNHGADAFRTFAIAWPHSVRIPCGVYQNRVNQGPL